VIASLALVGQYGVKRKLVGSRSRVMRHRMVIVLLVVVMASAAAAQSTPPATDKGDSWAKPAPASSAFSYRGSALPADRSASSPSPFKSDGDKRPSDQAAPSANDKAAVMGADRPWQNGQAPINCAESPHGVGC
jgi:predicted lipid-binding transport protein (Tim44 family)